MRLSPKLEQNMWTGSELVVDIALALDTLSVLHLTYCPASSRIIQEGLSNCPRPGRTICSPACRSVVMRWGKCAKIHEPLLQHGWLPLDVYPPATTAKLWPGCSLQPHEAAILPLFPLCHACSGTLNQTLI